MSDRIKSAFFVDTLFPMVDGVIMAVDIYACPLRPWRQMAWGIMTDKAMPVPCRALSNLVVCGEMSLES